MILVVSGKGAGRACLSETAGPKTYLHPVRPRTVARGKSIRPNGVMVADDPAVSERHALPAPLPDGDLIALLIPVAD